MSTGLYPNFRFTPQQERILMENGWCLVDRCAIKTFVREHAISHGHLEITPRGVSIFINGRHRYDVNLETPITTVLVMTEAYLNALDDDEMVDVGRAVLTGDKWIFPSTSPQMDSLLQEAREFRNRVLRNAHFETLLQRERGWKFQI
jgi:hypothetical protein